MAYVQCTPPTLQIPKVSAEVDWASDWQVGVSCVFLLLFLFLFLFLFVLN
jgi:hypothetical protein